MININFLLRISIDCQEKWLWEINKIITKETMPWSFVKFSQLILKGNVWRSDWRIWVWLLGLKGLKHISVLLQTCLYNMRRLQPTEMSARDTRSPTRKVLVNKTLFRTVKHFLTSSMAFSVDCKIIWKHLGS